MKKGTHWILGLLVVVLVTTPVPAQESPGEPKLELRQRVDLLFASVLGEDAALLDEVTCLDSLLGTQLRREAALGLIPDAADPRLVAERKKAVRDGVIAFVEHLAEEGGQIVAVDDSRLGVFAASNVEGEGIVETDGTETEITATGLLGLEMTDLERPVDLSVFRLGDRWCLDPLSIPSSPAG